MVYGIGKITDTPPSMDIGAKEITDWHVNGNGWSAIGYNYVIRRDGTLEHGRDLDGDGDVEDEVGAHAAGFNTGSLGICMVGGRSQNSKEAEANFTMTQYKCLFALYENINARHDNPVWKGHNEISTKKCPSINIKALFDC